MTAETKRLHLIVETYETRPDNPEWAITQEELDRVNELRKKGVKLRTPGECHRLGVAMTPEEVVLWKRKQQIAAKVGPWRAKLVDARTGETVFVCPHACGTRDLADRKGQQFKRRYDQTGNFDEPVGMLKPATAKKPEVAKPAK